MTDTTEPDPETPESVRQRTGVSLESLESWAEDLDGFVCHTLDGEGRAYECAGWHARFGHTRPQTAATEEF